jgi:molybdate transport system permease protein
MSTDWRVPPALLVPAAAGVAVLFIPIAGLAARAPLARLADIVSSPELLTALRLSLMTATIATLVCVTFGVPLAWILARRHFPGRSLVRGLVTVPLVLPPVIGGVALLVAFGRQGPVGGWLHDTFGVDLAFSTAGVVLAQAFVAMPFLVVSVEGAFRSADRRFDDVAATLGASALTTFRRVTVPGIMPGIVAGAVLCWARALGEFGATITFAGNFPGTTQTLPIATYASITTGDSDTAIVASLVMIVIAMVVLVGLRDRWLRLS